MDNKNLINGNTALAPKYKPYRPNAEEEFEKLKKVQKEKERAKAQKRVKEKVKILKGIAVAFAVGVILIGRYAAVYNMQKNLSSVKTEIHNVSMENENLKVQIYKASDIKQIEQVAKTKLHMIDPNKNNAIYVETTKDYLAKSTNEKSKNTQEDLIAKIKNILF